MVIPKERYTVDEATEYLGISRRTVYKLSKDGRLRTCVLSKECTRRFRKEDLDKVPQPLENGAEQREVEELMALSSKVDPVLAELWENEKDTTYDAV